MAYANIPDGDIDADSPGNVSLFTRLRDNPEAIALGLATATRIVSAAFATGAVDEAAIGSGAVHRAELSTGTEEEGTTSSLPASATFSSPDGYGFLPELKTSNASFWAGWTTETSDGNIAETNDTSYGTLRFFIKSHPSTPSTTMRIRYISSSPPYDFGDGPVGRFVYVEITQSGEFVRAWSADDPPWMGQIIRGPRRCDRDTGKTYIRQPKVAPPGRWGTCVGDAEKMDAYVAAMKETSWEWVELDMAKKLAPASRRPIPWDAKTEPSNRIVMLDPPCEILHRVQEMMDVDPDVSPVDLIYQDYLRIDSTPISRRGPPGVTVHGISWR